VTDNQLNKAMRPKISLKYSTALNRIIMAAVLGIVFAGAPAPAAESQPKRTVVTATNLLSTMPPLPDSTLAWHKSIQTKVVASSQILLEFDFSFTNVSSQQVAILGVQPSCSCTTAQLPPLPWIIEPDSGGQIKVEVNLAGKSGRLIKNVLVTTDKGAKELFFEVNIVRNASGTLTESDRAHDLTIAQKDRQAVFRGDCADCHAKPVVGKFGAKLYQTACGICHEGKQCAAAVPDLLKFNQPVNAGFWRSWIEHGKPGTLMPAFCATEGGPLTDNQIKSLTNYLARANFDLREP
jgi:mono/diheme cytochrome c family protein